MTDIAGLTTDDDISFARRMVDEFGVAGVPGSSFYFEKASGSTQIRFCFCKNYETLAVAGQKLSRIRRV
jgi:aminotransferase